MKKFLAMVLALTMVLSMAACSESSSVSDSSATDTGSTSGTDSSSQTTTTAAATTTDSEYSYDPEIEPDSSGTETETTTTRDNTPPPAPVGIDLKAAAKSVFNAKELKIENDAEKTFRDACDKGSGVYSFVADMKTSELFDPFDDLYMSSSQKAMEALKPDVQAFVHANVYDIVEEGQPTSSADGMIYALNFNCKDEAEAKAMYALVFTEEMKENAKTDADKPVYDFGTDHAIIRMNDQGENITMCYYRIGNNVLAAISRTVGEEDFKQLSPKNYDKQEDYVGMLDKLCKAFGAEKLPSSLKI